MADRDEKQQVKEQVKEQEQEWNLKVKGIGKETMKDIKRIYQSEQELIEALKNDSVPLRNDQVNKLRKHFQLN